MSERQAERLSLLPEIGGRFGEWFEAPHYMTRRGWGGCRRMDVSFLFSLRQRNKIKSRQGTRAKIHSKIWIIQNKSVSLSPKNLKNMYKSRAIPTLSGENAEYFREIQAEMEQADNQDKWQSVGEGVQTMMQKAGKEAWGF